MEDDAAMSTAMNLEPQSWIWTKECTFPSDMETAHNLIAEVMRKLRSDQWNDKDAFAVELALEETLTNAVKHGNDSDSSKMVRFDCKLGKDTLYVRIEDEGIGFDPSTLEDPREPANLLVESGRGVLLIKHFATKVEWNDRGNVIEFEKKRS